MAKNVMKLASALRKKNPGKPWQSYVKQAGKEVKAGGVSGVKKRKTKSAPKAKKAVSRAKVVVIAGTKKRVSATGGRVARAETLTRQMEALDKKFKAARSHALKMVIWKEWDTKNKQLKAMA